MGKKKIVGGTDICLIPVKENPKETFIENHRRRFAEQQSDLLQRAAEAEKAPEAIKNLTREDAEKLGIWF